MLFPQVAAERAAPRAEARAWTLLSYLVVAILAGAPRLLNLGVFLTGDESEFWLHRSDVFLEAIRQHDWPTTAMTTHPGVTTMWLGSAGLLVGNALSASGLFVARTFPEFLMLMRLPVALVHVAAVLIGYALLRRMFSGTVALLAALLWAADPFVVAFSRVLHVDALAGSFITLSLLAGCLYWYHGRQTRWLIFSGVSAGLAILSKSPALALMPWFGLIALMGLSAPSQAQAAGEELDYPNQPFATRLRALVGPVLLWGAICVATVFALWPALWVDPIRAYAQVRLGVEAEGAQPHMLGNFFLGREDDAPGALFYPVALALRLTPWAMLGVLLVGFAWRRARSAERRDLAALACFILFFIAALTLFPKKFNRYIEPVFPAVDILAAYGLAWGQEWLSARLRSRGWAGALRAPLALSTIVVVAAINLAWWHPYEILYFNQALGGAKAGANAFTTGWGEGLSEVADWLNQQPDITGVVTVTTMTASLHEYMRPGAQVVGGDGELPPKAGYVVVYVRSIQWGQLWPPFAQYYGHEKPLHVVTIHGVDYAWIYQVAPPVAQPHPANFGPDLYLRGSTPNGRPQPGQTMKYQLFWKTDQTPQKDYMLFAHLIGPDGQTYARADLAYPTSSWGNGRYVTSNLELQLPGDLAVGAYRLVVGLYDPVSGQRLPLQATAPIDPALDGPDALLLDTLRIGEICDPVCFR